LKFTKQLTQAFSEVYFVVIICCTNAQTNWNFEFAGTAEIFNTKKVYKPFEKISTLNIYNQRLLTFAKVKIRRIDTT